LLNIDKYRHCDYRIEPIYMEAVTMSSSLNVSLTDELRSYVNTRASDADVYATPSEYIRDLIRQDMEHRRIISHVIKGLDDAKNGRFSEKSVLEIGEGH